MERIKAAIEKARLNRKPPQPVSHTPAAICSPEASGPESIVYRNTTVIAPDLGHWEANRVIAQNKNDVRTMAIDRLRTQIVRQMNDNGWKTLAIVSPTAGCGKTVIAINLAISISQHREQTALLADFDLRRGKVAQYLGLPKRPSLIDFITQNAPLAELLVNPSLPRLVVLPNHGTVTHASEVLMSSRMKSLVSELRERYPSRFVVFDLPPLLPTDDAIAFMPHVDCALLVIANGANTAQEIEQSLFLLKTVPVLGTVLNKADVNLARARYHA